MASELSPLPLPQGVESHYVRSPANDLTYHLLTAGRRGDPLVLLLHGFPETSFCWRNVMAPIAAKGYFVVAPDTRGSGRTKTEQTTAYTEAGDELRQYQMTAIVRDLVVLLAALGYSKVHCLVGHDAGAVLASWLALARPDMVQRLIVASHPYTGPAGLPQNLSLDETAAPQDQKPGRDVHDDLLALQPPRKHYKWYYSGPEAAPNMHCSSKESLLEFIQGYYFLKSASWDGNAPHPLEAWTATELAKMPLYYIMPADCGMREAVERQLAGGSADCSPWMTGEDLEAMAGEWWRTGFQGALNYYRVTTGTTPWQRDQGLFAGAKLAMPTVMMLGRGDWGSYQQPGVLESMGERCADYKGERWIEGAGHWMQQEKPGEVVECILEMCAAEGR
jgi:pimeloyl-ACP methyl ester carboxylesterase